MDARIGEARRKTLEVNVDVYLNLDMPGLKISLCADTEENVTILAYIRHFLAQIFRFGEIGGHINGQGDFSHHLIEDVGICLGKALKEALGEKAGIDRSGYHIMPMEGSLATAALDLSGRSHLECEFDDVENKPLFEMVKHLLQAVAHHGEFDLYCKVETLQSTSAIRDDHHKLETLGKAIGRALRNAAKITGHEVLSTKGTLEN